MGEAARKAERETHRRSMTTLLLQTADASWRAWLKEQARERDIVCLDPGCADWGWPGRCSLIRDGKIVAWRFTGSRDPQRCPLAVLAAAPCLMKQAGPDALVLLFPWRQSPVLRQLSQAIVQVIEPDEILMPEGAGIDPEGWPVGPEETAAERQSPQVVRDAQLKARWIELTESCHTHEVDWTRVSVQGARLGSGSLVHPSPGYAEISGGHLHLIADENLSDEEAASLMDRAYASKITQVHPEDYEGLLCSFAHQDGSDFGMGRIAAVDPERRRFVVECTAIPPAPVRILKLGSLRIDRLGRELEEAKPWGL